PRHQVEPEIAIREPAEHDQSGAHHHREDRPANAHIGELHCAPPFLPLPPPLPFRPSPPRPPPPGAPVSSSTVMPVASSFRRLAASVSFPFSPSMISHLSPCRTPSVTACCVILLS